MGTAISLLSSKGGSGKTTLSLTIANLLADCGLKVLLVDCDLFTNGATFFYESRLEGESLLNFYDILYSESMGEHRPIEIKENLDFIPSIRRVTKRITSLHPFKRDEFERFRQRVERLKENYEVLLFDCSSGYSDVVRCIAPLMDQNLIVMEADMISMAAMRGLYLKLRTHLPEDTKFVQMYNKVREDALDQYKKEEDIFFHNIGAIAFDWAVPDAFANATAPTIANTSVDFGMQLYAVCGRLFQGERYQERLRRFHAELMLNKARTERNRLNKEMREYEPPQQSARDMIETTTQFLFSVVPAFVLLYFMIMRIEMDLQDTVMLSIILAVLILPNLFYIISRQRQSTELRRAKLSAYRSELWDLDAKIDRLAKELERFAQEESADGE